ncbi:type II secretion system protein [Vibrio hyugaensis]|uniref:type II secretion system protein n=1 Tax=Vibrio hyugaensis TaxID=1534743 RepID=UPI0034E28EC5
MKSKGFTLMEITIVLATLGSIALAALPILLDIHRQAYASMLHSSQSSLGTALKFFHAKVVIDDAEESRHITYVDRKVKMLSGMPEASADSIRALLEIGLPVKGNSQIDTPCTGSDFCIMGQQYPNSAHFVEIPKYQFADQSGLDRVVYIWPQGYTLTEEACYFYYVNQASTESIVRGHVTDGC